MSDTQKVMEMIKEHDVKIRRFPILPRQIAASRPPCTITEDFLNDGVMFDGAAPSQRVLYPCNL
jgi:hypothetical protein